MTDTNTELKTFDELLQRAVKVLQDNNHTETCARAMLLEEEPCKCFGKKLSEEQLVTIRKNAESMIDADLAELVGSTRDRVAYARRKMGIYKTRGRRADLGPDGVAPRWWHELLGTMTDRAVGEKADVSHQAVAVVRRKLGIPSYQETHRVVVNLDEHEELLRQPLPNYEIASQLGCTVERVRRWRLDHDFDLRKAKRQEQERQIREIVGAKYGAREKHGEAFERVRRHVDDLRAFPATQIAAVLGVSVPTVNAVRRERKKKNE